MRNRGNVERRYRQKKTLVENCSYRAKFTRTFRRDCHNCPKYIICIKHKDRLKLVKLKDCLLLVFLVLSLISMCMCFLLLVSKTLKNVYKSENTEIQSISGISAVEVEAALQIDSDVAGENYYYNLSYEDKVLIAKVVYKESRGEIFEGQVAVAAVVLNRYKSDNPFFANESIYSVVTQPYQFASINDVTMEMLEENPSCMEAVESACKGWDPTRKVFEDGAKFFYAPDYVTGYQKEIRQGIESYKIGNHIFHNDFNEDE